MQKMPTYSKHFEFQEQWFLWVGGVCWWERLLRI